MLKSAYILLVVASAIVGFQVFREVLIVPGGPSRSTVTATESTLPKNDPTLPEEILDPEVAKRIQQILSDNEPGPALADEDSGGGQQQNVPPASAPETSLSAVTQDAVPDTPVAQPADLINSGPVVNDTNTVGIEPPDEKITTEEPAAGRPVTAMKSDIRSESHQPASEVIADKSQPVVSVDAPKTGHVESPKVRQQTPLHSKMVTPGNFEYLGAFRTPLTDTSGAKFSYGGWAVTWRGEGVYKQKAGELPGSLFIAGHRHHQLIAEISIPQPVISKRKSLDDLPVARVLQPLADISAGTLARMSGGSSEPFEIGGLQVVGNRLHWTTFKYYNVEGRDYLSHGVSSTDLQRPAPQGLWHLGPANSGDPRWHSYKHAGYICAIPEPFATKYLGGRNLMSGLQICTGLTYSSQGPALYAYRLPEGPVSGGLSLNALPMLWYSMQRPVLNHHYADRWTGAAWVSIGNKHTIVIAGRKAHGPVHYGPARPQDCYEDKGYHGSSYEAQILFYAPGNLVAATRQSVADTQPWYRWDSKTPGGGLNRFMFQECGKDIGGLTYDRERNLLYMVEVNAGKISDNEWEMLPVVHIFRLVP